jgi:hypothetical protein
MDEWIYRDKINRNSLIYKTYFNSNRLYESFNKVDGRDFFVLFGFKLRFSYKKSNL